MNTAELTTPTIQRPPAAPPKVRRRRLHELPSGAHGVVHAVGGADAGLQRLMAMGLCVGREVEVVQNGNPLILRLLGARIGVSERLAEHVEIERCTCSECCGNASEKQRAARS